MKKKRSTQKAHLTIILASLLLTVLIYAVLKFGINNPRDTVLSFAAEGTYQKATVQSVSASTFQDPNRPQNVIDQKLSTRWSAQGGNQWLQLTFDREYETSYFKIAAYEGTTRVSSFEIQALQNGKWVTVYTGKTNGKTNGLQTFNYPNIRTTAIRLVGKGNSRNDWNSYTEFEVWVLESDNSAGPVTTQPPAQATPRPTQNSTQPTSRPTATPTQRPTSGNSSYIFITPEHIQNIKNNSSRNSEIIKICDGKLNATEHAPTTWYVPGAYRDNSGHHRAKNALRDDANVVYAMGICYQLTKNEKYATTAARLLNAWATQVKTFRKEDDSMLSFSYHFPAMTIGANLLQNATSWTSADQTTFKNFVRSKALPMSTINDTAYNECQNIFKVSRASNNWAVWGTLHTMAAGAYLQDNGIVNTATNRWKQILVEQMDSRGHLMFEVTRTDCKGYGGIWYTNFALHPYTIAAEIATIRGNNLFNYSSGGKSLKLAYDAAAEWIRYPSRFPYAKGWSDSDWGIWGREQYSYFEIAEQYYPNEHADYLLRTRKPPSSDHSAPYLSITHRD